MSHQKFLHRICVDLRYGDTDRQGHINNAVFATLFESGRVDFLVDEKSNMPPTGCDFVIAEMTIKFMGEMRFPGRVNVLSAVTRLGNSSIGIAQELQFAGATVATASSVIVMTDRTTRKSKPMDEATRAHLTSFMAK